LTATPLTRTQRLVHARCILRFDADDLDPWVERLRVSGDTGDQSTAAHGNENRVDVVAMMLAQNLHRDRALPGDHIGIVEWMHEHEVPLACEHDRMLICRIVVVAVKYDFAAKIGHRAHFDLGGRQRHHDHGWNAPGAGGKCDALRMVTCRGANDTAGRAGGRQLGDLVVSAANFERKHRLQVFPFEQDAILETAGQTRGRVQSGLDGDVVHFGFEDFFYVIFLHG
jgi:hypothetical protein